MLRRQFADNSNNKEIFSSEYKKMDLKDDPYFATACLINITKAGEKRWIERKNGEKQIILDSNYKWVLLYPKKGDFSVMAIYNIYSDFVQFTFDIGKNVQYKTKIPYLDDLYLDIVMTDDGEIQFLGEEELENAYKTGTIKPQDYEIAKKSADRIVNTFFKRKDYENLKATAQKYYEELQKME